MAVRSVEPERLEFDLVVIGGGLSGLCAAIAAARHGARTALIQDRPVLGGNSSSEVRVVPHGANSSNAWAAETGIVHDLLLRDRATNHESFFDHGMMNSHYDFTLMQAVHEEPLLDLFLNTVVRGVDSEALGEIARPTPTRNGLGRLGGEDRRITGVLATQMASERELLFVGKQYIDATGDGTVGFLSGADFRYGREARDEFGETLAPVESDDVTMGATITMRARDVGRAISYQAPSWIEPYTNAEAIGYQRTIYPIDGPIYGGFWWLEVCNPFHQIQDTPEIRHELHRHVLGVWNFIKNHSELRDEAANFALDWIGMIPGKRESRRLMGDVIVTEQHCHRDQDWPDVIGEAGWWIDLHIKGGILNKEDPGERENADRNYKHWIRVPVFGLPLRAFYSRNVANLWMAGRCLSASHVGLGPVRVMQTLGQLGQSVGTAAAYAVARGLSPREAAAPGSEQIAKIQQLLLRDDVRVPGIRNTDPCDLARMATITGSSESALDLQRLDIDKWHSLGPQGDSGAQVPALGMIVPVTSGTVCSVSAYLRNDDTTETVVTLSIQGLKTIWDRDDDEPRLAPVLFTLAGGFEGWVEIPLNAALEAGRPYRFSLTAAATISWAATTERPVGTAMQYLYVCQGGPEPRNSHLGAFQTTEVEIPAYRHWRQSIGALALRLNPAQSPFMPVNVTNGRAWPEDMPNLWISDPAAALPQYLDLSWDVPRTLSAISIAFDTNLSRATQSAEAFFTAPECVRDWRLLAHGAAGWSEIFSEKGNFQRRREVRFTPVLTDALRVEILATNGCAEARVFEVRAYA